MIIFGISFEEILCKIAPCLTKHIQNLKRKWGDLFYRMQKSVVCITPIVGIHACMVCDSMCDSGKIESYALCTALLMSGHFLIASQVRLTLKGVVHPKILIMSTLLSIHVTLMSFQTCMNVGNQIVSIPIDLHHTFVHTMEVYGIKTVGKNSQIQGTT